MALHVMDEANHCLGCKVPRCQQGCPIHTNIPEVIRLLKANKLDEAGRMLFENNPLTTVCSLVCNHENQCEGHCVRGIKGAPVHFSVIENYISSTYASQMTQGPAPSNGKKAAIIGSGPAGLTIAVILARYGYDVTIFESHDKIGGVLRYGIPEFRLPKSVLDDFEYRHLRLKGIKVRPNTDVGKALNQHTLAKLIQAAVQGEDVSAYTAEVGQVTEGLRQELAQELKAGLEIRPSKKVGAGFRLAAKDGSGYFDCSEQEIANMLTPFFRDMRL